MFCHQPLHQADYGCFSAEGFGSAKQTLPALPPEISSAAWVTLLLTVDFDDALPPPWSALLGLFEALV